MDAMRERFDAFFATRHGKASGREREFFSGGWQAGWQAAIEAMADPQLAEIGAKAALLEELGPDKDAEHAWSLEAAIYIRNARACLAAVIERVRGNRLG